MDGVVHRHGFIPWTSFMIWTHDCYLALLSNDQE